MRRPVLALVAAGALAAGAAYGPTAAAAPQLPPLPALDYGFQGEGGLLAQDADARGSLEPSAAQRAAARELGARATWGRFGGPLSLTRDDAGFLSAPASGLPADVARAFVHRNAALFGLSAEQTAPARLAVLKSVPLLEAPALREKQASGSGYPADADAPYVVTFQQVFADVPTGHDGLLTVGLDRQRRVAYVSSTVTGDTRVTNESTISPVAAYLAAAKDAGVDVVRSAVRDNGTRGGVTDLTVKGVEDSQRARLVTVPVPGEGVKLAFETIVLQSQPGEQEGEHPHAYRSLVDAQTGEVLVRTNALQHAAEAEGSPGQASLPYWAVFPNAPRFPRAGVQTPDDRQDWCYKPGPECARVLGVKGGKPDAASPYAYDETLLDDGTRVPTFSTTGNNARTAPSRVSFLTPDAAVPAVSPQRTYDFPFTDQWHSSNCDPASFTSPQQNDIDAATTNLFVMHNRMHDWGYYLGFTEENYNAQVDNAGHGNDTEDRENDPEIGNSQAGSVGGGPTFQGRDNANQITLNDGIAPITNQYLWEPLQAGFYAPCTDGAYDMGIVGHEYGHMISNRMTAGPDEGLVGNQASSMGEAWSDLMAVEYLNGYGLAPQQDENRFSLAPYVTGDKLAGIRNYGMDNSPLTYGELEYDGNGTTSPHADGEIWNATQYDVRTALVKKYASRFPEGDRVLQAACADGLKPSTACPGNRRWVQMLFDGFLLQPAETSMLTSRDAMLASNKMRYGGTDLPTLWSAFAKRGMGSDAKSDGPRDLQAVPGFRNPLNTSLATFRFRVVPTGGGAAPAVTNLYVGAYEARTTPVRASRNGAPSLPLAMEPGTYRVYLNAKGFGHRRLTLQVEPGAQTFTLKMRRNLAASAAGGRATGDGGNLDKIIDETEGTNGGSVEGAVTNPDEPIAVRGKQVTVDLAGGAHLVREVQVSAANRPAFCAEEDVPAAGCEESREAPYDTGGQSRFAALRSFRILVCDATTGRACKDAKDFRVAKTALNAFPAGRPRPTAPDLALRTFPFPTAMRATHVRLEVLDNQCTGGPEYQGSANPSANPLSDPDCTNGFTTAAAAGAPSTRVSLSQKKNVRLAELQVFSTP